MRERRSRLSAGEAGRDPRPMHFSEILSKPGNSFVSSESISTPKPLTRAEQEVQSASERLNEQIDEALAAVAALSDRDGVDELEARAARLERAARDLAVALRELGEERRNRDSE